MKHIFLIVTFGVIILSACKKEGIDHKCYDSSLVHDGICPTDCPGFKGCDGVTYCNSCEAAREGIGAK